jgi:hypothetical protein
MTLIILLAVIALSVITLTDVLRAQADRVEVMPKALWVFMVLIPIFGPIAWYLAGRPPKADGPRPNGKTKGPAKGPDDDPDFLWKLEKKMRQSKREKGGEPEASAG